MRPYKQGTYKLFSATLGACLPPELCGFEQEDICGWTSLETGWMWTRYRNISGGVEEDN